MYEAHRKGLAVAILLTVLFSISSSSALKHGKNEKENHSEQTKKDGPTSKNKAGKINWLGESHKVFRDHDGDIVVSIHDRRPTKKDIRASKRSEKQDHRHHAQIRKLQWLGKGHKVFRDNQGDIVTSIHHQRPMKREQTFTKRTKAPNHTGTGIHWLDKGHKVFQDGQNDVVTSLHHLRATKKDERPDKSAAGSKIKWLGNSKKVFQDSHYDIVTSLHHQKGFKKSPKAHHQTLQTEERKRSEISGHPSFAQLNQEDVSSGGSGTELSKLAKKDLS